MNRFGVRTELLVEHDPYPPNATGGHMGIQRITSGLGKRQNYQRAHTIQPLVAVLANKELRVHIRSEVAIETRVGIPSEVLIASGRTSLVKNPKNAMLDDHNANRYLHTAYRSVSANR
jgi:hypothetical protein